MFVNHDENNNPVLINIQNIELYTECDLKKRLFLPHNFEFLEK